MSSTSPRLSRRLRALATPLGLAALHGAMACAPADGAAPRSDGGLFRAGEAIAPWQESVVRARAITPLVDVTDGAPSALILNLFDDVVVHAERTRVRPSGVGQSWQGHLREEVGDATFVVVDGIYAGSIRTERALYQVGHRRDIGHYVAEYDADAVVEHPPVAPMPVTIPDRVVVPVSQAGDGGDTTVDVMVMYTAEARDAAGGAHAMDAVIDLAIVETNAAYANSEVGMHLNLVHAAMTNYDETAFDWSETLDRLRTTSEGHMDEVHALREQYGADHVVLIVNTVGPYAGIGYQMQSFSAPFFDSYAFSVVARDYATGAYTFAHELGHNMGATHDHDNANSGFHPYSFGLQVPSAGFRTVMAYSCAGCVRVGQWSNPDVAYNEEATGVANYADNARTLNETKHIAAAFREATTSPPTDIAEIVSPAPKSVLSSDTMAFTWDDAGALAYRLDIGTTVGGTEIHTVDYGQHTSATVTGLPVGGQPVFVRLWSESQTVGWRYNDYDYTAWSRPFVGAEISSPVPGSVLSSGDVVFSWAAVEGGLQYRLSVGTEVEPTVFFFEPLGTGLSAQVSGLPTDGRPILATLETEGPGGWTSTQATYTAAAQGGAPPFAAPLEGTTLAGGTQTFSWSDIGALQYWISVQRSDGSYVFSGSVGLATEITVSGLPTDGSGLRVTLFAQLVPSWVEQTSTYIAAGG